jgi:hypothetical protein
VLAPLALSAEEPIDDDIANLMLAGVAARDDYATVSAVRRELAFMRAVPARVFASGVVAVARIAAQRDSVDEVAAGVFK